MLHYVIKRLLLMIPTLLGILVITFVVVQFVLSQEVTGKDTALSRLTARLSQLTELLSLEQTNKLSLEEQIAQLRAGLSATDLATLRH